MKQKTITSINPRWTLAILILVPFFLFFITLKYGFSPMDEQWLIVSKFNYLKNWDNLLSAFTDPVADMYYRPLLTVSFMIDAHLGELNPPVYHFTNLALHIICVILLYRLLLLFKTSATTALFFSLLFAVHPALTHAVVWVPGRNDVLLCLFSLLSFIFLLKHLENDKDISLLFHLLSFAGALLSKETAISLPVIYLGILYYAKPVSQRYLKPILCWLALGVMWYLVRNVALTSFTIPGDKSLSNKLENMGMAFLIYAGKIIWPVHQSITPTVQNSSLLAGIVTLISMAVTMFIPGLKNRKLAGLGILIFCAGLALSLFFGASSILGEHYEHRMYLPMVGAILFLSQLNFNFEAKTAQTILCIAVVALAVKTFTRFETYSSPLNYVTEGLEDCPKNYVFHLQKGTILFNQRKFNEALPYFNDAITLQPNRIQSLANRANNYAEMGEKELAIADLDAALRLGSHPNIFLNKTVIYFHFNDFENALINFQLLSQVGANYLQLLPKDMLDKLLQMSKQRGLVLGADDKPPTNAATIQSRTEALQTLEVVTGNIVKQPGNAELYVYRAKVFVDLRRWDEALADLKKACDLQPGNTEYREFYNALNNSMPHKGAKDK